MPDLFPEETRSGFLEGTGLKAGQKSIFPPRSRAVSKICPRLQASFSGTGFPRRADINPEEQEFFLFLGQPIGEFEKKLTFGISKSIIRGIYSQFFLLQKALMIMT